MWLSLLLRSPSSPRPHKHLLCSVVLLRPSCPLPPPLLPSAHDGLASSLPDASYHPPANHWHMAHSSLQLQPLVSLSRLSSLPLAPCPAPHAPLHFSLSPPPLLLAAAAAAGSRGEACGFAERAAGSSGLAVAGTRLVVAWQRAALGGGAVRKWEEGAGLRWLSASSHSKEDAEKLPSVPERRVNRAITARQVRLVAEEGHEVLSREEALTRARAAGMDLVEVNSKSDPPICRLMDYSKFRFEQKRKEKEQKKQQLEKRRRDEVKDVRISSRTERNDLDLKLEMAVRHLRRGHRVRCVLMYRTGDQQSKGGLHLMDSMVAKLSEVGIMDNPPKDEGHRVWSMFRPKTEKKGSKSNDAVHEEEDQPEKHSGEVD